MASPEDPFQMWLSVKLKEINPDVDLDVFVDYIHGILDTDTDEEDKLESLVDILGEIVTGDGASDHCQDIMSKWDEKQKAEASNAPEKSFQSLDEKLAEIREKQCVVVNPTKTLTAEEAARKAAILAQYENVSEGEDSEDDGKANHASGDAPTGAVPKSMIEVANDHSLMTKNLNALMVDERGKAERERLKEESDKKKAKDKEDREKQKNKAQERKDKEKQRTMKGEKRR